MRFAWLTNGRWAVIVQCTVASLGCASAPSPATESAFAAESGRARAVLARLIEADRAGDVAGVNACFQEEAVLLPPEGEPIRGRGAIEARYRALMASERRELKLDYEETMLAGNAATVRGRVKGKRIPLDGSATIVVDDMFTAALRRAPDRVWRITHLEWD